MNDDNRITAKLHQIIESYYEYPECISLSEIEEGLNAIDAAHDEEIALYNDAIEAYRAKVGNDCDDVESPKHYTGEIECIDAMIQTQGIEAVKSFCICNAFKYLWRWTNKGGYNDLKKARWYLDKAIELDRA